MAWKTLSCERLLPSRGASPAIDGSERLIELPGSMLDILHRERGHAQRYPSGHIAAQSGSRALIGAGQHTDLPMLYGTHQQEPIFPSARRAQFTRASLRGGDCAIGGPGLLRLNLSTRIKTHRGVSYVSSASCRRNQDWDKSVQAEAWSTARPGHEDPLANPGIGLHQCLGLVL